MSDTRLEARGYVPGGTSSKFSGALIKATGVVALEQEPSSRANAEIAVICLSSAPSTLATMPCLKVRQRIGRIPIGDRTSRAVWLWTYCSSVDLLGRDSQLAHEGTRESRSSRRAKASSNKP